MGPVDRFCVWFDVCRVRANCARAARARPHGVRARMCRGARVRVRVRSFACTGVSALIGYVRNAQTRAIRESVRLRMHM